MTAKNLWIFTKNVPKAIFVFSYWCCSCIRWSFRFQKESFRKNIKTNNLIDHKIRDEKLQYDINRDAVKISVLSSLKIDKYEYFTGEEILPFNQRQIIEQAKSAYSPLGKASENQTEKQVGTIKSLDLSNK